jgi:hypothetical protein
MDSRLSSGLRESRFYSSSQHNFFLLRIDISVLVAMFREKDCVRNHFCENALVETLQEGEECKERSARRGERGGRERTGRVGERGQGERERERRDEAATTS